MRNDLLIELYLGEQLGWVDVSADGRQGVADSGGGITINRQDGDAGTMDLVLASPGGKYSPRNPRSPYYGLLGRNTPVRFGIVSQVEQFDVDVPAGWGPPWEEFGIGGTVALADWLVTGGTAVHLLPTDNAYRATAYKDRLYLDAEVRTQVTVDRNDIGGGAVEPANVFFRRQAGGTGEYYMTRVEVLASQDVRVSIHHSHAGVIAAPVTVAGLVYAGQPLEVAASCVGDRLAVKVWPAGSAEPRDWQLTGTDTRITTPGQFGLRSGVAAGNTNAKPIRFSYSNLRVIDRRAHMEVSEWPPRWNTPGTDSWVPIQAAGILRRLVQGAKPLDSALFRAYTTASPAPLVYWPLEDGRSVNRAASGLPGGEPITELGREPGVTQIGVGNVSGLIAWGVAGSEGAASLAGLQNGGRLSGRVPASSATSWTFEWVGRWDAGTNEGGNNSLPMTLQADGQWEWSFLIKPDNGGTITLVAGSVDGSVVGVNATGALPGWDGYLHHIRLDVERSGADSNHYLFVDGEQVTGGVWSNFAAPVPNRVLPNYYLDSGDHAPSIGHLALWAPHAPFFDTVRPSAAKAWVGELAADRIERLCAEQGVPVAVSRGPDPSPAMGPQRIDTFLNLLRECADVDMGILGEAREQLALTYRCLGSLYNQTPVELDYTHLAPPLEPVDDDALVRNDVTASRPDGGTARAVLEVGPLSTAAPPDGVGVYDTSVTVNVASDGQLPDQAGWRLHLGTQDDARYPTARVNLAAPLWQTLTDLAAQATALADGDLVELGGLPDWLPPGPALSMVHGSVEQVDEHTRTIGWTWLPGGPYMVATVDGEQRVAADGSTLAATLTGVVTSLAVWSFRTGLDGWVALGGTAAHDPAGALVVTPDGASASAEARAPSVAIAAGQRAAFVADIEIAGGGTAGVYLLWRDASQALMSTTNVDVPVAAGERRRVAVTGVAPAGAAFVMCMVGTGSTPPTSRRITVHEGALVVPQDARLTSTLDNGPWTVDPLDMPVDIRVGGERVTASLIDNGDRDEFNGTITGSWGTTDAGRTWTHLGSSSAFRVGSGSGWHLHTALNTGRHSLIDIGVGDHTFLFAVAPPVMAAGMPLTAYAISRVDPVSPTANQYQVRIAFLTDGRVTCTVRKRVAGIPDSKSNIDLPGPYSPGQFWFVKMQTAGATVRGKVWPTSVPEPPGWMTEWVDPDPLPQSWTQIGVTTLTEPGSTNTHPIEYPISTFQVLNPQRITLAARGVNGVQRTWPAGTDVDVWRPAIAAL